MEMGVDRILFSVDYPFVPNPPGSKWMDTVPLSTEDKGKILSATRRGCSNFRPVAHTHCCDARCRLHDRATWH